VRMHTRMQVYSKRSCRVFMCPSIILVVSLIVVAAGILLALREQWLPGGLLPHTAWFQDYELYFALGLVATGLLTPLIFLRVSLCFAGSESQQQSDFFGDAVIEQCLSSASIHEHYDVAGEHNAEHGTLVFIAGATAPRHIMWPVARRCASRYRVITVDMPGHGSLVNVPFSLPRAHQVLTRVIDREMLRSSSTTGSRVAMQHRRLTSLDSAASGDACLLRSALVAWGASGYIAMHSALQDPSRWAGLVLLGPLPDYLGRFACSGRNFDRLFALRWLAFLYSRGTAVRVNRRLLGVGLPSSLAAPSQAQVQAALQAPQAVSHVASGSGVAVKQWPKLGRNSVSPLRAGSAHTPGSTVDALPGHTGGHGPRSSSARGTAVPRQVSIASPPRPPGPSRGAVRGPVVSLLEQNAGGLPRHDDFNFGVIPAMRRELSGLNMFSRLREFPRPVVFVGTKAGVRACMEAAPLRTVSCIEMASCSNDVLPPQDAEEADEVVASIQRCVSAWRLSEQMSAAEARELQAASRSSVGSRSSMVSWA